MSLNRRSTRAFSIEDDAVSGSRRASHFAHDSATAATNSNGNDKNRSNGNGKSSEDDDTIERILHAADPNIKSTPVYFDYRKDARMYKFVPSVNHTAAHLSINGLVIRQDSTEAVQQREERERRRRELDAAAQAELNPDLVDSGVSTKILKNQFNYSNRGSQTMNRPLKERVLLTDSPPKIVFSGRATAWTIYDAYEADRLQSERAAQAKALLAKHEAANARGSTGAQAHNHNSGGSAAGSHGPTSNSSAASANAGHHGFDDYALLSTADERTGRGSDCHTLGGRQNVLQSPRFGRALKIIERMVNQNDCFDIIDDFKFWEDQSDLYKDEGTLLPLWQFFAEGTHRRTVTAIALNNRYDDFFAVGYGSYEFQNAHKGVIHCFTLKNAVPNENNISAPAHPEFTLRTESGVLCLAFHPTQSALLACGLSNGVVCVFDLRIKDEKQRNRPIYRSTIRTGAHSDAVWEVYWRGTGAAAGQMEQPRSAGPSRAVREGSAGATATTSSSLLTITTTTARAGSGAARHATHALESGGELSLYSISTDGHIMHWVMHKKELTARSVVQLHAGACSAESEAMALGRLSGTCMDYSAYHDKLVVGTQEGQVQLYTFSYNMQCVARYAGHSMAVYTVRWNYFHPSIFLTCSADWTAKLWLRDSVQPLLTFDLGDSVGDVAWAPHSATIFAAVTNNGKVYIFDLDVKKTEPLCVQTVVKNAKLTHVVFSHVDPILYVGDTRGTVLTLKLSPNLRRVSRPTKKDVEQGVSAHAIEVRKMTKLIHITMKNRTLLDHA